MVDRTSREPERLRVTIELGRTHVRASDIDGLENGSLVALDSAIDEPVNVYVEGELAARGEIVVVDHRFCVRVTESITHVNAVA